MSNSADSFNKHFENISTKDILPYIIVWQFYSQNNHDLEKHIRNKGAFRACQWIHDFIIIDRLLIIFNICMSSVDTLTSAEWQEIEQNVREPC